MDRFSEAAAKLAGLAGALLGWRPHEFWTATPTELAAIFAAFDGSAGEGVRPDELAALMEMFPDG